MVNNIKLLVAALCLVLSSCVSDDIIDSKPGEALAPVENLQYIVQGSAVQLTWDLPSSISSDVIQPVSVQIRVAIDGQSGGTFVLDNAPESFLYSGYDPLKTYRFTVKVLGEVDTTEPHISNLRYSLGKTIEL
ncbi:MAG TPA: DUF4945 domain-containing protein [Cyclobacteriaceae bacterium]|nr:DUF4945 domain-containing protein [Cyclobacteriaceae bacterium]